MNNLQTLLFNAEEIKYDGHQLSPHWIYRRFNLLGNALVAFTGPADVTLERMVDLEDVKKHAPIYSPKMLHFIGEYFPQNLELAIARQHLLIRTLYELLLEKGLRNLSRRGDDLFAEGRKLSVSIATTGLTSSLIHVGVNIETDNTPIPTAGLHELGVEVSAFAANTLERMTQDEAIRRIALVKVLPR